MVGRRVLENEAAGLNSIAAKLDDVFINALDLMAQATGRVVVAGMGKSGHVARKIAATLASTGTPSQYVNAADASHGDLGMITGSDVVIVLSNSGETPELSDIVAHAKLHSVPLIAITSQANSLLDKAADVSLVLPDFTEACSLNLAPTTSTTMMMALGDALAVALLERMGFSPENFSALHPGGQLGQRFIKIGDIMHAGEELPIIDGEEAMSDALLIMTAKHFGCVGVIDDRSCLKGIITDGDLRRHMGPNLLASKSFDVMTPDPQTLPPDTLAASALRMMNEREITALFVVSDEKPIGIVHIHDLLRAGIV